MFYIYINFYQDSMSVQSVSCSVVSDSLRPYGLQPAMLLCPWISAGQNTGVGGQFLLQGIFPTEGSILFFRAQGTNAMWYPGGEGSLGENGYIYMCGWVSLLSTWNYHNIVNQPYSSIKYKV